MATIKQIIEKMRNPLNNSWIPLRKIDMAEDGTVADIRLLDKEGNPQNVTGPLELVDGLFVTKESGDISVDALEATDGNIDNITAENVVITGEEVTNEDGTTSVSGGLTLETPLMGNSVISLSNFNSQVKTIWITLAGQEDTYEPPEEVDFWLILNEKDLQKDSFTIADILLEEELRVS